MPSEPAKNTSAHPNLTAELRRYWLEWPRKIEFLGLLAAWLLLFHFWGNITLGYVKTSSLFGWMYYVFSTSADDQHGFLIPLVVLVLLWMRREELSKAVARTWWPAFGLFVMAVAVHLVGFLVQQTRVSIIAFFLGIYALLGLVWGKEFMKRIAFPMFLFIFCVPLGTESDRITFPLRMLASKIAAGLCNGAFGIGVLRDGTRLFDASGHYQYEVAAACSGIRSLTAIFAISTIYAFLSLKSGWKRMLLIALAFPLAIVSNVIRLMMIVLAAELFGKDAGNYVHESSWLSLLPYIPAVAGLVLLARWLGGEPAKGFASDPLKAQMA
jgi:exosortase